VQEGVLQPCWQIALCADKEFSKPLQFTNETDTLNVQNEATLVWADEVYEMVLSETDIYGVRLNLYNAKTEVVRASVRIPISSIPINQPTTHRFPLIPATPGAHNISGDVQLTLTVLNPKLPKSTVPAIEIDEGLKSIK
jgi:hypothetical protein